MEIVGETLHLYSVTRSEMGSYMCIARDTKHTKSITILFHFMDKIEPKYESIEIILNNFDQ